MSDRFEQLLSGFLWASDSVTESQVQELSEWIKKDDDKARLYIEGMVFHRNLCDIVNCRNNKYANDISYISKTKEQVEKLITGMQELKEVDSLIDYSVVKNKTRRVK